MRGHPLTPRLICGSCKHPSWDHTARRGDRVQKDGLCRRYTLAEGQRTNCHCTGWDPIENPRRSGG